ncbi:hypothetical protein [Oceanisphaera ostreae]|uniref:Peptidase n=1 Tax=Oceanisphaera ostreae TaxID=914151 RepID=A0ABW3KDW0_9GAMM
MSHLLETPSAYEWIKSAVSRHSNNIFGKIVPAVVWIDAQDENGNMLVPLEPSELVSEINSEPYVLLNGHDPGKPIGQVIEGKLFVNQDGIRFVAAILGFYAGGDVLQFDKLGFDTKASVPSPKTLIELPNNARIQIGVDPREIEPLWIDQLTMNAEIQIERLTLSHNEANATIELIRVGLPYLALVWNPFVTAIGSEAGKATYAAFHSFCRSLIEALVERRNPVLDIQGYQNGCTVSFLFRGKDVNKSFAAHDALPKAAASAAQLITKLKERNMPAQQISYEFNKVGSVWYPSHAILEDGRIITDSMKLIAFDRLSAELSLGTTVSPLAEQIN